MLEDVEQHQRIDIRRDVFKPAGASQALGAMHLGHPPVQIKSDDGPELALPLLRKPPRPQPKSRIFL